MEVQVDSYVEDLDGTESWLYRLFVMVALDEKITPFRYRGLILETEEEKRPGNQENAAMS